MGDDTRPAAAAGSAVVDHHVPHSREHGSQACRERASADDDHDGAHETPHRYLAVFRSSQTASGLFGSTAASTVMPGLICPICIWLTVCWVVAGRGGRPSAMTVRSNWIIRSKLIMPTCCIELITTVRLMAVPSARPAAAAAAALAAAVWLAIICCMLAILFCAWAILACASAIRWPAGGMFASISLPIFCRSRMFLNIPMSGRPV